MKIKTKFLMGTLLTSALLLGACTNDETNKTNNENDEQSEIIQNKEGLNVSVSNVKWTGAEQVVVNDETFTVKFMGVKTQDTSLGKEALLHFEIENKGKETVEFSLEDLSVDGYSSYGFEYYTNQVVAPNKKSNLLPFYAVKNAIENEFFPKFEKDIEGTLVIYDEYYDVVKEVEFKVDLTEKKETQEKE